MVSCRLTARASLRRARPAFAVDGLRRGERSRPTNFMPESGEARAWDVALVLRSAVQWVLV